MDSAMIVAPMFMSYLLSSAAPFALLMGGADFNQERLARGAAQMTIMSLRSVMDVTYDDMLLDQRTGDFSVRGIEVTLPDAAGVPGCTIKIDALTLVSLDRPDALSIASEADGIEVSPACAGNQSAIIRSMLGPDALDVTHYEATTSYYIGQSTLDHSMLVETAVAGSISVNTRLADLYLNLDQGGDPIPAGKVTRAEVTVQDIDALRDLLPIFGLDADPVGIATGAMRQELSEDGISNAERAFLDSAEKELSRVMKDGGAVTLRSGRGAEASFEQLGETRGPEDLVKLMLPVFSSALVGADNLVPSALLKAALSAPDDLSAEDQIRVAEALATGEGAPLSRGTAAKLLKPLAEAGNPKAALGYARLLHQEGEDLSAAYTYALAAGKAGASGARNVLDRIESDLPLPMILDIQAAEAGDVLAPEADIAALRNRARGHAQGQGAARHYGQAILLGTLAAAGGDASAKLLIERLAARFENEEDAKVWSDLLTAQSEAALALWADGFGDGFGAE